MPGSTSKLTPSEGRIQVAMNIRNTSPVFLGDIKILKPLNLFLGCRVQVGPRVQAFLIHCQCSTNLGKAMCQGDGMTRGPLYRRDMLWYVQSCWSNWSFLQKHQAAQSNIMKLQHTYIYICIIHKHYTSLYIVTDHYISLCITICHCISLYIVIHHSLYYNIS
jgi:hypothetical protein